VVEIELLPGGARRGHMPRCGGEPGRLLPNSVRDLIEDAVVNFDQEETCSPQLSF